jgi:S1-C subfamily serine protease
MVADQEVMATFVGSDEKTNVTVLKMERLVGKPVRIGFGRPIEGSLVMMLNPANGSGRVQLWTGGERDFGVVVGMDGSVAGFSRFGHFLGTAAAKPVIDQIIAVGKVQRAVLGVRLTELRPDFRDRARVARGTDRPALVVDEVTVASPAEKAGLKAGDLILELEEQPVSDLTTWSALLARGGEAKLLILRDGTPRPIRINLEPTE